MAFLRKDSVRIPEGTGQRGPHNYPAHANTGPELPWDTALGGRQSHEAEGAPSCFRLSVKQEKAKGRNQKVPQEINTAYSANRRQ